MQTQREARRAARSNPKLALTPMIDVVFLLLIFFVVTLKVDDVYGKLDVARPQPEETVPDIPLLRVDIYPDSLVLNGRRITDKQLTALLGRLGSISRTQSVIVTSHNKAHHERLVRVLDACVAAGLENVALFSR